MWYTEFAINRVSIPPAKGHVLGSGPGCAAKQVLAEIPTPFAILLFRSVGGVQAEWGSIDRPHVFDPEAKLSLCCVHALPDIRKGRGPRCTLCLKSLFFALLAVVRLHCNSPSVLC